MTTDCPRPTPQDRSCDAWDGWDVLDVESLLENPLRPDVDETLPEDLGVTADLFDVTQTQDGVPGTTGDGQGVGRGMYLVADGPRHSSPESSVPGTPREERGTTTQTPEHHERRGVLRPRPP